MNPSISVQTGGLQCLQNLDLPIEELQHQGPRNARVPIHRLPSDVLERVFSWTTITSEEECDLVRATHVCGRWRDVALDYTSLWTTITVTTLDKATTFVGRAKGASLLSFVIRDGRLLEALLPTLGGLTRRLRSLIVEVYDTVSVIGLMTCLDNNPVPHLVTLHVTGHTMNRQDYAAAASFMENGGRAIFMQTNHTPPLRSLLSNMFYPPWNSPIYSNLSALELDGLMRGLSEKELLKILRQCPHLERLVLGSLAVGSASESLAAYTVALPLLSRITLRDLPYAYLTRLLSHLILPAATRYDISLNTELTWQDLTTHPNRLADWREFYMADILFEHPDPQDVTFYLFPSADLETVDPLMTVSILYALRLPPRGRTERVICAVIPRSVNVLILRGWEHMVLKEDEAVDWIPVFDALVHLRVLRLEIPPRALAGLFRGLGALAVNDASAARCNDAPGAGWPCPKLEALELVGVTLSDEEEALITQLLRERAEVSLALRRVEFVQVDGLSDAFLGRLHELGTAVRVTDSPRMRYANTQTSMYKF